MDFQKRMFVPTMRILETLASADPASGGPLEGLLRHAEVWRTQGHVCELATLDPPDAPFLKGAPLRIHALGRARQLVPTALRRFMPPLRYGYTPGYVGWLRAHAAAYDAVIVNGLWNYSTMGARLALTGGATPYFVFSHGMMDPWFRQVSPLKHLAKQAFWRFIEGPLVKGARAVLFTTEEEKVTSREVFTPYHIREEVVGYGTSDVTGDGDAQRAAFRMQLPGLGERRYLLYLSRIHPKKGCDLLVKAFAEVAARMPDIDLVIAGPDQVGWRSELEAIAMAVGISDRIHWPGMLLGDVKWGAFRGCEAFILPSHQENFGVVVVEALACNKPVLISNRVNIWREVADAGAGLVEDDTLEGTMRLVERFAGLDAVSRNAMGAAGRMLFLDRYTIDGAAATLLDVITREGIRHGRA